MASETKRMTKEELREDEFVEWLVSAVDYIRDHRNAVIVGIFIVVAGIFGIRTFIDTQHQNIRDAAALWGDVLIAEQGGQFTEAGRKAEHIITNYAGSPAAGQATIFLANLNFSQEKYAEAEKLYGSYLDIDGSGKTKILLHAAEMGLLACAEVNGDLKETAISYEALASKYADQSMGAWSLMNAARCFKNLGDIDRSTDILRRISVEYPKLPIAKQARNMIDVL